MERDRERKIDRLSKIELQRYSARKEIIGGGLAYLFTKVFVLEALTIVTDQLTAEAIAESAAAILHLFKDACGIATPTAQVRTVIGMQTLAILGYRAVGGRGIQIIQRCVLRLLLLGDMK